MFEGEGDDVLLRLFDNGYHYLTDRTTALVSGIINNPGKEGIWVTALSALVLGCVFNRQKSIDLFLLECQLFMAPSCGRDCLD